MNAENDPRMQTIFRAIQQQRQRQGIKNLRTGHAVEGSCIAQGEDVNLFNSLVRTQFPYGDWQELNDEGVLQMIYGYARLF